MAQEIRNNMEGMENNGETMASAVSKIIEAVLPGLAEKGSKDEMVQHMEKILKWIEMMPDSLHPSEKWSREEFRAVMMGPVEDDSQLADYMDDFYEEYTSNTKDEHQDFYMKLFQNEQQISDVDWPSLWGSVRASYEQHKKLDEDLWLTGGRKADE